MAVNEKGESRAKDAYLFLRIEDVLVGILLRGSDALEEFIIEIVELALRQINFRAGGNHVDLIDTAK